MWLWWKLFFRYLFPYALVAGIIGGLGVGAYVLTRVFADAIAPMSAESRAVILAAMATPVVAVLSVVFSHYYSRKREIEAAQRTRKIEFYEEFLHEYFDILSEWKQKKLKTSKDKFLPNFERQIRDHAAKTARRLILWGGAKRQSERISPFENTPSREQILAIPIPTSCSTLRSFCSQSAMSWDTQDTAYRKVIFSGFSSQTLMIS